MHQGLPACPWGPAIMPPTSLQASLGKSYPQFSTGAVSSRRGARAEGLGDKEASARLRGDLGRPAGPRVSASPAFPGPPASVILCARSRPHMLVLGVGVEAVTWPGFGPSLMPLKTLL